VGVIAAEQVRQAAVQVALAARLGGQGASSKAQMGTEWMSASEVATWLGYSERTIHRYTHDGTWRKGEHWVQHKCRPRYRRSALESWMVTETQEAASPVGLAYGPDVPVGRRHRSA